MNRQCIGIDFTKKRVTNSNMYKNLTKYLINEVCYSPNVE